MYTLATLITQGNIDMDNLNKPNLDATKHLDARITDAATDLLNEGKKYASDVYQQ